MNWSEKDRNLIIKDVTDKLKSAGFKEEQYLGLFAVLWFCRLDRLKSLFNSEIHSSKETVLLEERERGKIWAGAYLIEGIVKFKTYDLRNSSSAYKNTGIPYLEFKSIFNYILNQYSK